MDSNIQAALGRLRQGPVQMVIDPDGDNVEAYLQEGLEVTFGENVEEAETDILGVYDLFTSGSSLTFSANLDEQSSNVVNVLFVAGLQGSGYRGFGRSAGVSMRTHAKHIRFRPWQTRAAATNQLDIWKAVPEGDISETKTKVSPWRFASTWRGLPDATKADGELLARITVPARS